MEERSKSEKCCQNWRKGVEEVDEGLEIERAFETEMVKELELVTFQKEELRKKRKEMNDSWRGIDSIEWLGSKKEKAPVHLRQWTEVD